MTGNLFVFRPGGPSGGNVFNDWHLLISAMSGVEGRKMIEFDDSLTIQCEIPPGIWPMKDVMWAGFGPVPGKLRSIVHILSDAQFTDLRMIGGQITIVNLTTGSDPSPISDFDSSPGLPDIVQIGMRDDCGNPQLVNPGEVPMFDLGKHSALFFLQNCVFGMPFQSFESYPLIRHTGQSQLTLNLLGQNQTGSNIVRSEAGASVLFGALSSSAQVAFDQASITSGGKYDFGPQGRIQRHVIPLPPNPLAKASQLFDKPNVLIRCDGTVDLTQNLPSSANGFTISFGPVKLYSGGQEVVVAEVAGGELLKVRPAAGDTIDEHPGEVHIGKHGSRTFLSDGVSNCITISKVGG